MNLAVTSLHVYCLAWEIAENHSMKMVNESDNCSGQYLLLANVAMNYKKREIYSY